MLTLPITPLSAQVLYKPGLSKTLTSATSKHTIQTAIQADGLMILQLGKHQLVAFSVDSAMERWRFTSKTGSIRAIHQRSDDLLLEAEQLYSINPSNGEVNWQVQLNCYSEDSCNTRVRKIGPKRIYLSGFDGSDDYLMIVDAESGLQQWPVWLKVPKAQWLGSASNLVVVATGEAPFSLLGLDRRTGRVRWRFRPDGAEKPAIGLSVSATEVIAWWPGMAADTVYSLSLETGVEIASWIVSKRARRNGSFRGGGPGYYYAWQPSLLGDEGVLRVWDVTTGQTRWRKRLKPLKTPQVSNGKIMYWTKPSARSDRFILHVVDALTGKELWRYERRSKTVPSMRHNGPILVLGFGYQAYAAIVLMAETGRVLGVGTISKSFGRDPTLNFSNRFLFATRDKSVQRFDPTTGDTLLQQFEEHLANGEVKEVKLLHKSVLPFVDELPAAAQIHRKIVGKKYRSVAAKMRSGSFSGLLLTFQKMASDDKIVFYEDFRALILHFKMLMGERMLPKKLGGGDRNRLLRLVERLEALLGRFERKMDTNDDTEANSAATEIMANLCVILSRSKQTDVAYRVLHNMWTSTWLDRTPFLQSGMKTIVSHKVQGLLPAFSKAVTKEKGQFEALRPILDIGELALLVDPAPSKISVSGWDATEFADFLRRLRAVVRPNN